MSFPIYFRRLCLLLNAENIYRIFSEILLEEDDCKFASRIVQLFNLILMTSRELFELRSQLQKAESKVGFVSFSVACSNFSRSFQEASLMFCVLYKSWCHNPVATVSLCLLSQNYRHTYDLLLRLYPFQELCCCDASSVSPLILLRAAAGLIFLLTDFITIEKPTTIVSHRS